MHGGIFLHNLETSVAKPLPNAKYLNQVALSGAFIFTKNAALLYESLEFLDCLHVPLRVIENSEGLSIGDFLRKFLAVKCESQCNFDSILRFHNDQSQFYITDLHLRCDHHARLFTETAAISIASRSANLCSEQSCLKFIRSLHCLIDMNRQTVKDLVSYRKL